jgi:hypothetical protein
LLLAVADIEVEAEAQPLAEVDVLAQLGVFGLPFQHDGAHRTALGRATADHALDVVLRH